MRCIHLCSEADSPPGLAAAGLQASCQPLFVGSVPHHGMVVGFALTLGDSVMAVPGVCPWELPVLDLCVFSQKSLSG